MAAKNALLCDAQGLSQVMDPHFSCLVRDFGAPWGRRMGINTAHDSGTAQLGAGKTATGTLLPHKTKRELGGRPETDKAYGSGTAAEVWPATGSDTCDATGAVGGLADGALTSGRERSQVL